MPFWPEGGQDFGWNVCQSDFGWNVCQSNKHPYLWKLYTDLQSLRVYCSVGVRLYGGGGCIFDSRVLRIMFGAAKRGEQNAYWWKFGCEQQQQQQPNVIQVIKLKRMWWVGHVARTWERRGGYKALVGILKQRNYLEDPSVDVSVILKWILSRMRRHVLS